MKFLKDRVNVICNQLKKEIVREQINIKEWQKKDGCYITPEDADKAENKWESFDAETMRWYGKDTHYWFRTDVTIPESMEGKKVWLHVRTQLEEWDDGRNPQFLVFIDGTPVQGLDINHREILLFEEAKAGTKVRIDMQSYTGTLHSEFKLLADVEVRDDEIKDLYYDIQVPLWGLERMDADERTARRILEIINETTNHIDLRAVGSKEFYESVRAAREYIRKELYENPEMSGFEDVIATCIGHTHIDVAWLWTVAQVRQKSCRSFATVLKLMDEYPNYKFMSSQPILYAFVKERHPDLYQRIKDRVAEGRWEPEGGMWVEADCNLTSGESLVRQFLVGKRFFKDEFGKDNEILWLPDVFGYSAALPQILKKSGIKYFMTTKLAWNEYNKIPMDTFMWEGIDGSKIFTHLITTLGVGQPTSDFFTTYNGMLHPDAIMGGWTRYQQKDINNDILISYGYGDGGGGPTRQMLETSTRMEKGIKGIPKVRQEFSHKYFEELYERVKDSKRLPSWVGELYFEFHRGTYTSMAKNKKNNRKSEYRMMELELLSVLAMNEKAYPAEELDAMWKTILMNQFHDILPGSAIKEAYDVTDVEYAEIMEKSGKLLDERMDAITPSGDGISVLNTLGFNRNDVVVLGDVKAEAVTDGTKTYAVQQTEDGAIAFIENIPSKGYKGLETAAKADSANDLVITADGIETPYYVIKIDEAGQFTSVFDKRQDREVLKEGAIGNELRVYEDKPRSFDNWNVDVFYTEKSWPVLDDAKCEWIEEGPVRATLKVTKRMLDNEFVQKIHFYAGTPRIDFETLIDWKLSQHLVKVHFPVDVHTDEATFDIQFGNLTRKIHQNTSWDEARFESCAHKWADMSEGGYGVSLMNDCKYGYSALDGNLSITLLKAGTEPNETADLELHSFTYSFMPHEGTWKEAGTVAESFNVNVPLRTLKGGSAGNDFSFMSVDSDNVILETVKRAEDGNGIIVRLYEVNNKRTKTELTFCKDIKSVKETDLMEKDIADVNANGNKFTFTIKPFEIKTFRIDY
ncbi:alpha-mannosidase [Butyrivibrio sp. WCD3002]|uniref:alpha-mannosidase n=1 Tax=Butyrivibrio sp. WCD3002 TaxID=1280676 RepID=UPI00040ABA0D|nr:alpha-mannosidase [Butyrivibrio sp. WCD3002]